MAGGLCQRSGVHRCGVGCLVVATLMYATGVVAPFWVLQAGNQATGVPFFNIGLWFQCGRHGNCNNHDFKSDKEYLKTTRILQVMGLVGLLISLAIAFFTTYRRQHQGHSAVLPVVTALAALQSLSGSMVYVAFTREDVEASDLLHYDWALALSVGASGMALIAAGIISIADCCCPAHTPTESAKTTSPVIRQDLTYSDPGLDGQTHSDGMTFLDINNGPFFDNGDHVDSANNGSFLDSGDNVHSTIHAAQEDYRHFPHFLSGVNYDISLGPPGNRNMYTVYPGLVAARRDVLAKVCRWDQGSTLQRVGGVFERHEVANSEMRQGGLEISSMPSPSLSNRLDQHMQNRLPLQGSQQPDSHEIYSPPSQHTELSPFMLPRVVVRGFYEPGCGYPEYVML